MFRCLQGLDDESIGIIQDELQARILVIAHSKAKTDVMELDDHARRIKEDKALREEILLIFRKECPTTTLDSWQQCIEEFNVSNSIYEGLRGSCQTWLKEKLQTSKKTPDFPSSAIKTIQWLIQRKEGKTDLTSAFPWQVINIGQNLSGVEFLTETITEKISIGLAFLDLINGFAKDLKWTTTDFNKVLRGLLGISTTPSQATLFAFVKHEHIRHL